MIPTIILIICIGVILSIFIWILAKIETFSKENEKNITTSFISNVTLAYATAYLVIKNSSYARNYAINDVLYVMALYFLHPLIKKNTISLNDIKRQVNYGCTGMMDIRFSFPSQATPLSMKYYNGEWGEYEELTYTIRNIILLKLFAEDDENFLTLADVNIVRNHEPIIKETVKEAFKFYQSDISQKNGTILDLKQQINHFFVNNNIADYVIEYNTRINYKDNE